MKAQLKMDEFAFVLLAGIILIAMLMITWTTPTEPLPIVDPTSVFLTVQKGTTTNFDINITGGLGITNVTLSSTGEISSWLRFNKNNFDVKGSTIVTVRVAVPTTAPLRTYNGNIIVKSTGGEKTIPVSIDVSEVSAIELFSRSTSLGDFSIKYSADSKTLDSKENVEVSKSTFSEHTVSLFGSLSDKELSTINSSYIQLLIEDTNKLGNLIVFFNNKEIYNQKVESGAIEIPVDVSSLKNYNTISIRTESPGWMFWTSSVYKIRSAKLIVNFKGTSTKEFTFSLESNEISKFDHFQLAARIKSASTPMQELLVKIDNQIVFFEQPPISMINTTFSRDILGNKISLASDNTISFSIEKEGSFDLSSVVLSVFYGS